MTNKMSKHTSQSKLLNQYLEFVIYEFYTELQILKCLLYFIICTNLYG